MKSFSSDGLWLGANISIASIAEEEKRLGSSRPRAISLNGKRDEEEEDYFPKCLT
jgi:hypothetical protein